MSQFQRETKERLDSLEAVGKKLMDVAKQNIVLIDLLTKKLGITNEELQGTLQNATGSDPTGSSSRSPDRQTN